MGRVVAGLVQRLELRHPEEVVRHSPEERGRILGQGTGGMEQGVRPPDRRVVGRENSPSLRGPTDGAARLSTDIADNVNWIISGQVLSQ